MFTFTYGVTLASKTTSLDYIFLLRFYKKKVKTEGKGKKGGRNIPSKKGRGEKEN